MNDAVFSDLPDDVVLKIFFKLDAAADGDGPRNWARVASVCTRFSSLIRDVCWRKKCLKTIPSVVDDLLSAASSPPGGWSALQKLAVCCPGVLHTGVLLAHPDLIGPTQNNPQIWPETQNHGVSVREIGNKIQRSIWPETQNDGVSVREIGNKETQNDGVSVREIGNTDRRSICPETQNDGVSVREIGNTGRRSICPETQNDGVSVREIGSKVRRSTGSHLASGVWNLSREQGNKLLASRFRSDVLYICDWPGCVHTEEKRNYMLFRGIFKEFKQSRVWTTINDGNRSRVGVNCAFCWCNETWDLHSAFCLKRGFGFGFHDDGEPVVRAYVCENGHVSGAWTALPLYT